jgi:hypothetical protein
MKTVCGISRTKKAASNFAHSISDSCSALAPLSASRKACISVLCACEVSSTEMYMFESVSRADGCKTVVSYSETIWLQDEVSLLERHYEMQALDPRQSQIDPSLVCL